MTQMLILPVPQIRTHGLQAAAWEAYAIEKVTAALRQAPAPVLHVTLLISSVGPQDRVDAVVEFSGAILRVHAAGRTVQEAVDLMQDRLRGQMRRMRRRPARRLAR